MIMKVGRIPNPGETVIGGRFSTAAGGKGANQAVAASLAGGDVAMLGGVGDDAFATRLVDNLKMHEVDCDKVQRFPGTASGLAVIAVDSVGQNSIMVVPGANSQISTNSVQAAETQIKESDCLMVQLETPSDTILEGISLARRHGVRVVLDPAPAPAELIPALLQVDLICPNETEAAALTQMPVTNRTQAETAAKKLQGLGATNVVITMGSQGALLLQDSNAVLVPAIPVDAIDTTAAGDAFAGALAVRWAQTDDLLDAVRFANVAGAIAASRTGAQNSIGTKQEIDELLSRQAK